MDLFKSDTGIVYLEDQHYLSKVYAQIIRDFEMTGIDVEWNVASPESYTELFEALYYHINRLVLSGDSHFKNLLYRIDVSEKRIHQRMITLDESKLDIVLTKMIIERCLQKVLTREKFSS
jgi:hypothetical protein